MGEMRNVYKIVVGKPEGKRPLGRSRCRWEDNIEMDLRGMRLGVWSYLIQDMDRWRAFVNTVMKSSSIKGRPFLD
jgi:hypothetical protein